MSKNADYEQDIDYILHIEHELPMEWYLKLDPLKKDLAKMVSHRVDVAVRDAMRSLKYDIASDLKENIGDIILKKDIYDW